MPNKRRKEKKSGNWQRDCPEKEKKKKKKEAKKKREQRYRQRCCPKK